MSSGEYGQADEAGRLLAGRYRVVAQLGRGGMGVVWRALDEVLGREVAVKELRTYTDADGPELADLRLRMQREARAAARVRHPGVVAVHDVTEVDGRPLIVMELVDGPSLDDVLRERGTLDPREAAGIGAKVMEALTAAHEVGVLHRDVKPGNILLDRSGRVVLTDFGIAAMEDPGDGEATRLTHSGALVGSLDYLAPERAQGVEPGPASDIWALGATLYAAVEGSAPFRRTSTFSTLTAIVTEPLPEPHRAGPLGPVLQRLMDKRPESRPEADEARALLQAVAESGDTDSQTAALRGPTGAGPAREATELSVPSAPPAGGPPEAAGPHGPGFGSPGPTGPAGQAVGGQGQGAPGPQGSDTPGQGVPASDLPGAPRFTPAGQAVQGAQGPATPGQGTPPAQGGFGAVGHPGSAVHGHGTPAQPSASPYGSAPMPSAPHAFGNPTPPPQGPEATGPMVTSSTTPTRRKGRALLAAAAVTVVLAAAGGAVALLNDKGDAKAEAQATSSATSEGASAPATGSPDADRSGGSGLTDKDDDEKTPGATKTPSRTAEAEPDDRPTTSSPTKTSDGGGTSGGTTGGGSGDGGTTGGGTTGGGGSTPTASCSSIGGGKYNCQVWKQAKSYTASGTEVGVLNAGTNYFYCQQNLGRRETYGEWTNVWWAKTDDDSGNTNVFISDVYIEGGNNDEPVPGLPVC
ncbi:serine/threonine-protein kinase [Streptomyces regalis]|uniref:non-specific serine/threonine protein kinase n=1 Tax=Streptomyces regalis TaxID=68262 RepID=A0A0X3VKA9_9ACTN|nr:serine/threonine-protein kinase [Streptomyces regalis]KUL45205.1 kinase [Streptomyces regalis]